MTAYYRTVGRLPTASNEPLYLPEGCSHWVCVQRVRNAPKPHAADESCPSHRSQPNLLFASPKAGYDKVINENAVPHLFIPGLVSLIRPRS